MGEFKNVTSKYFCLSGDDLVEYRGVIYQVPAGYTLKKTEALSAYKFRGKINFQHLINDCIADGKFAFLVTSKTGACFGTNIRDYKGLFGEYDEVEDLGNWHIYQLQNLGIPTIIKTLNRYKKFIEKERVKIARKIRKQRASGEFSNQPETRVMVF